MTKFQDELKTAIAEWHDAMNTQDIKYIRKHSGKKLESLINRAVPERALRLCVKELNKNRPAGMPQYPYHRFLEQAESTGQQTND